MAVSTTLTLTVAAGDGCDCKTEKGNTYYKIYYKMLPDERKWKN